MSRCPSPKAQHGQTAPLSTPLIPEHTPLCRQHFHRLYQTSLSSTATEKLPSYSVYIVKGPRKAVSGYKIAPNRFKTTYRSVLTFEEKKQSIIHLFKTFSGLRLGCNAFILAKRSKIRSTEHFKTSAILNARFRESYFKLKVNGRTVMSQTG